MVWWIWAKRIRYNREGKGSIVAGSWGWCNEFGRRGYGAVEQGREGINCMGIMGWCGGFGRREYGITGKGRDQL